MSRVASFWHSDLDMGRPMDILMTSPSVSSASLDTITKKSFYHYFDQMKAEGTIPNDAVVLSVYICTIPVLRTIRESTRTTARKCLVLTPMSAKCPVTATRYPRRRPGHARRRRRALHARQRMWLPLHGHIFTQVLLHVLLGIAIFTLHHITLLTQESAGKCPTAIRTQPIPARSRGLSRA